MNLEVSLKHLKQEGLNISDSLKKFRSTKNA